MQVARPEHPAFRLERVTWSALAEYPWVIQMVGRHRTLLEKALASEGVDMPRRLTECGSVTCLKALVADSDSLTMLPALAIEAEVKEGRIKPLDIGGPLLNRDIAVIFRDQFPLTPAGRDLVDSIAAVGLAVGDGLNLPSDRESAQPPRLARRPLEAEQRPGSAAVSQAPLTEFSDIAGHLVPPAGRALPSAPVR
jgi:hypothetical protein